MRHRQTPLLLPLPLHLMCSLAVGIVLAVLAGMVVIGGVNRIANIAQFVVPFTMAVVYVLCAVVVLFEFSDHHYCRCSTTSLPPRFQSRAVLGGAAGIGMHDNTFRRSSARSVFSRQAGMGSAPRPRLRM